MRMGFLLAISLLLASATIGGAEARSGKPHVPQELYQQMLAARVACDTADEALFNNMQQASDTFARFCRKRGFPQSSRQLSAIESELYSIANTNPYAKDQLLAKEVDSHFPDARTQVSIQTEISLSDASVNQLAQFTPESWHAVPGSLTIVHNERDLFLVWAAGIDGKPLKDKNDHVRLICTHLAHR